MFPLRKRGRMPGDDDDDDLIRQRTNRQMQLTIPNHILKPMTMRDRLLQREVMELNPEVLPVTVQVLFPDVNDLHEFIVRVSPDDGMWKGGTFDFKVTVPENYNMAPPKVRCLTPAWHPNITHPAGEVCLSLLRVAASDDMGWTPTRHLKDIVLGLDALFGDLVNFDDPLNQEAADLYRFWPESFHVRVKECISKVHASFTAKKLCDYPN